MIHRTSPQVIAAYHNNEEAVGQSTLKLLMSGVDYFNEQQNKVDEGEKSHFIYGSAIDCLLTEGEEVFNDKYFVTYAEKPSGKTLDVINLIFKKIEDQVADLPEGDSPVEINHDLNSSNYDETIIEACNELSYYGNRKDETRLNGIREYSKYFEELVESKGKQILSEDQYRVIYDAYTSFTTHEDTKLYFSENLPDHVDVIYQLPLYFEYQGVKMKCLLDMVIINHQTKRIIPLDIKTMSGFTSGFHTQLLIRRYDIQAAAYTLALQSARNAIEEIVKKKTNDYIIHAFRFIVESTTNIGKPRIFELDQTLLNIGRIGRPEVRHENVLLRKKILGLNDLVGKYAWHLQNGFENDQEMVPDVVKLNWEGVM